MQIIFVRKAQFIIFVSVNVFLTCNSLLYGHRQVFVGDVVMLKNPEKPDDYLVRRLAAIEGYEMVSEKEKEEPFILEKDQCWVLSDNEALKAKVYMLL